MIPDRNDFARASTSPYGAGFISEQLAVFGLPPVGAGNWISELIGKEIPDDLWIQFVRAGDARRIQNYAKIGRRVEDGPLCVYKPNRKHQKPAERYFDLRVHESGEKRDQTEKTAFYNSPEWQHLRAVALRLGRYRCSHCGATSQTGATLHVDHIEPLSINWSRRLDLLNLQVLCKDCNIGKSNLFTG